MPLSVPYLARLWEVSSLNIQRTPLSFPSSAWNLSNISLRRSEAWRSAFFLFASLAALCLAGGLICIDKDVPSAEVDKRIDWIGACLVSIGLVLIVFALGDGTIAPQKWRTPCKFSILLFLVHY